MIIKEVHKELVNLGVPHVSMYPMMYPIIMLMYPWILYFVRILSLQTQGNLLLDPKFQKMCTSVLHGSMDKYPWNLDMIMETFTHVHGYTLMLLCKSTGFLWKQDGSMETRWIFMEISWISKETS